MITASVSFLSKQPVDKVFNCLISEDPFVRWPDEVEGYRIMPVGMLDFGFFCQYSTTITGRETETDFDISFSGQTRTYRIRSINVPKPLETVYSLVAVGKGTRVTITLNLARDDSPGWRMIHQLQLREKLAEKSRYIQEKLLSDKN